MKHEYTFTNTEEQISTLKEFIENVTYQEEQNASCPDCASCYVENILENIEPWEVECQDLQKVIDVIKAQNRYTWSYVKKIMIEKSDTVSGDMRTEYGSIGGQSVGEQEVSLEDYSGIVNGKEVSCVFSELSDGLYKKQKEDCGIVYNSYISLDNSYEYWYLTVSPELIEELLVESEEIAE